MISSSETAMFFFVCSNILSIICITYLIPFIIKEFAIASNVKSLNILKRFIKFARLACLKIKKLYKKLLFLSEI